MKKWLALLSRRRPGADEHRRRCRNRHSGCTRSCIHPHQDVSPDDADTIAVVDAIEKKAWPRRATMWTSPFWKRLPAPMWKWFR